jgi:hypothetical protein
LLVAIGSSAYLLFASGYAGFGTNVSTQGAGVTSHTTSSLVQVNGGWAVLVMAVACSIAGAPLLSLFSGTLGLRFVTWLCALLLLGFSLIAGFTVGLYFMPAALILLIAGVVSLFVRNDSTASSEVGFRGLI